MRSSVLVLVLLAACRRHPHPEPVDTDTDPAAPVDTDTDVPLTACAQACERLCVPEAAVDSASCLDTSSPRDVCWHLGFQRCERQTDGACGWTMLDRAGWDACRADPPDGTSG